MIGQFIWKMAWVAVCCLGLSLEIMAQSETLGDCVKILIFAS